MTGLLQSRRASSTTFAGSQPKATTVSSLNDLVAMYLPPYLSFSTMFTQPVSYSLKQRRFIGLYSFRGFAHVYEQNACFLVSRFNPVVFLRFTESVFDHIEYLCQSAHFTAVPVFPSAYPIENDHIWSFCAVLVLAISLFGCSYQRLVL